MMLSNEKSGLLKNFLGTLPEQAASKLAEAVEVDRLMDGRTLPHEAILTGLRPSLHKTQPHADAAPAVQSAFRRFA